MCALTAVRTPRVRGLIFTDTVPALLDGTKTQTRRPVKGAPADAIEVVPSLLAHRGDLWDFRRHLDNPIAIRCPLTVGDRFYVKERWDYVGGDEYLYQRDPGAVLYEDRGDLAQVGRRWRNPMFMPRWAARLWYEVTEVRVQRVQDISEADARAEGVDALDGLLDAVEICRLAKLAGCGHEDNRAWFAAAWEHIHDAGSWEANPWVWALTFKRIEAAP